LPKPFNPRELLARIRPVLRRAGAASPAVDRNARMLTFLDWRIDCRLRELRDPQGTRIVLTGAEFALLQVLCERAGRALSREQLLDLTQGRSTGSLERSIDVLISRLRRKIERDPHDPAVIKTVRSGGYLFAPPVEAALFERLRRLDESAIFFPLDERIVPEDINSRGVEISGVGDGETIDEAVLRGAGAQGEVAVLAGSSRHRSPIHIAANCFSTSL
jgi:DNA-binding winged helix-turn-helix (wHTH) protein